MVLLFHILGAISFFGVGVSVLFNKGSVRIMRALVAFELVTGTILSISAQATLASYCAKMGIYLAFWMGVEIISSGIVFDLEKSLTHKLKSKSKNN